MSYTIQAKGIKTIN